MLTQISHRPPASAVEQTCLRDERIRQAATAALRMTGYRSVAELECEVVDGMVVLSGVVTTFYMKQLAQAAVLRLDLVRCVEISIEVRQP
ncbi:MAG: BON domain-containing protein [Planctomycetia bacterium]|nr:BON domain-containing protein [Planctomycetia bacterium]